MKSGEKRANKGYNKVRKMYYPFTIYFECEAEKEKVFDYAKKIGKSMRQYVLQVLFEQEEPEVLVDAPRNARRMYQNKGELKEKPSKYLMLLPKAKHQDFVEMAEKRKMSLSKYASARIRADLQEHGVALDYQNPHQYLILFNAEDTEQDRYANTIEEANEIIEGLKKEGISNILLIDTINRKRSVY